MLATMGRPRLIDQPLVTQSMPQMTLACCPGRTSRTRAPDAVGRRVRHPRRRPRCRGRRWCPPRACRGRAVTECRRWGCARQSVPPTMFSSAAAPLGPPTGPMPVSMTATSMSTSGAADVSLPEAWMRRTPGGHVSASTADGSVGHDPWPRSGRGAARPPGPAVKRAANPWMAHAKRDVTRKPPTRASRSVARSGAGGAPPGSGATRSWCRG